MISHHMQSGVPVKRQRRTRWNDADSERVVIPGMPTVIPADLTPDQERMYILQLQIEELTRRLRIGDLGIPINPEERSPSPEPVYNMEGKRLNTRESRARKKLEEERHNYIQKLLTDNPDYKPPIDYKPIQTKASEKVVIPQEQHPDINFVGLLIGPRGNTLKSLERDSGAKIIIRGKGSVKEGKVCRKDGQPMPGEDEPLHAFVTAPTSEQVKLAVSKINEIVRKGIELPENQNDLRRTQLRELAQLNGTLRDIDSMRCSNCGSNTHKSWQCPDKPNITNTLTCYNCGGLGHLSRDCKEPRRTGPPLTGPQSSSTTSQSTANLDEEYMSFMAELGEKPTLLPPAKDTSNQGNSEPSANRGHTQQESQTVRPSQLPISQSNNQQHQNHNHSQQQQQHPNYNHQQQHHSQQSQYQAQSQQNQHQHYHPQSNPQHLANYMNPANQSHQAPTLLHPTMPMMPTHPLLPPHQAMMPIPGAIPSPYPPSVPLMAGQYMPQQPTGSLPEDLLKLIMAAPPPPPPPPPSQPES